MYAITEARFDFVFFVSTVSQFTNKLALEYVTTVKRIFQYLRKYPSFEIMHKKSDSLSLDGYVDPNWTMDPITCHSTTRFVYILASGVVSASSKR